MSILGEERAQIFLRNFSKCRIDAASDKRKEVYINCI